MSEVTCVFSGESVSFISSREKDGKFFLLGTGLFLGPGDEHHEVVRVPDGQEHRSPRLALVVAELADGIAGAGVRLAVVVRRGAT